MSKRQSNISRITNETKITLTLNLDGGGICNIDSGIGFLDHMLNLIAFWGRFDLKLQCSGDLRVDSHHTLEDIGLCLGQAIEGCLGDKKGLARTGWARVPMDEALSEVILDLSGRPYIIYSDDILPEMVAGDEKGVWREFFKSIAFAGKMNLHINFLYGKNGHHLIESAAKGFGLALAQGVSIVRKNMPSTKGKI